MAGKDWSDPHWLDERDENDTYCVDCDEDGCVCDPSDCGFCGQDKCVCDEMNDWHDAEEMMREAGQ